MNNILNSDNIRSLMTSKLAAEKARAEVQARENILNQNAQTNAQIAQ